MSTAAWQAALRRPHNLTAQRPLSPIERARRQAIKDGKLIDHKPLAFRTKRRRK
jgi:hypothetical protein